MSEDEREPEEELEDESEDEAEGESESDQPQSTGEADDVSSARDTDEDRETASGAVDRGTPARCAELPQGFWRRVDYMLQHPDEVTESLKQDRDLWRLSTVFVTVTIVMSAIYGAVMGATNLLQGSSMETSGKLLLIVVTAIKVPVLFLLTLTIVLPPVYVSNCFIGARLRLRQTVAPMLGAMATTSVVLASMATVAFFFALTSRTYHFIKLLHVLIFIYAGLMGLAYLFRCVQCVAVAARRATPAGLLFLWLLLYAFVGTQLAWVLRPFIAAPDQEFEIFRPREGNFYESVFDSLKSFLKD